MEEVPSRVVNNNDYASAAAARKGLLKAMIAKFSSTPIEATTAYEDDDDHHDTDQQQYENNNDNDDEDELRQQLDETESSASTNMLPSLTESERNYLSTLLASGDAHSMLTASHVLRDPSVFPPNNEQQPLGLLNHNQNTSNSATTPRSSSKLQQHLFRMHQQQQKQTVQHKNSILLSSPSTDTDSVRGSSFWRTSSLSPSPGDDVHHDDDDDDDDGPTKGAIDHPPHVPPETRPQAPTHDAVEPTKNDSAEDPREFTKDDTADDAVKRDTDSIENIETDIIHEEIDELTNWLDGSMGIEVTGDGSVVLDSETAAGVPPPGPRRRSFAILGTSADDVSCHPHVLSPPLMESLLQFVPTADTTVMNNNNVWLKYSLVRDGPGLYNLLRHVRASACTFLAIETDTGRVLGSYTSQPWRLAAAGWYGGTDSFLWNLRHSRVLVSEGNNSNSDTTSTSTIMEQVQAESEVQVYPYRPDHKAIQYCSKHGIMLGQSEIMDDDHGVHTTTATGAAGTPSTSSTPPPPESTHYGHGLYISPDCLTGSTSTSETYGNPCLIDQHLRGQQFRIANLEVWTLTPHDTVTAAEQSELSSLFLERPTSLTMYTILSGGPI